MASKKSVPKKKSTRKAKSRKAMTKRRAVQSIGVMKGGVVIGGDVRAKHAAMRDQYIDYRQQLAAVNSPQTFVAELEKLRAQIAGLRKAENITPAEIRRVEVVEADVAEAIEEAKKPQPLGKRINQTLDGASETMGKIGKSITAAIGLGSTLAGLGGIALKLFGG